MIRTDYLPRICAPAVVTNVFSQGRKAFEVGAAPNSMPTMPIEFSVAAFRLGHSMIRADYSWNKNFPNATLEQLFEFSRLSGGLSGANRLPSIWIADWRRLYNFGQAGRQDLVVPASKFNQAMRIDTKLVNPLRRAARPSADPGPEGQPRLPQPDAGEHGQARHRPADGDLPEEQGRDADDADEAADPRRQQRRQPRARSPLPS